MLEGSILQKLYSVHLGSKRPLNLGVYYKNTLVALCHALEDFILESNSTPLMITAFQRGKWYLQEADRYGEIAQKASDIAIMAASDSGFESHPTSQRSNVTLINLKPEDPVAQEWHLIVFSPTYTAMVLCQELSETDYGSGGLPKEDLERKFYGFWTFEPELVKETVEIAIAHIATYDGQTAKRYKDAVDSMTALVDDRQRDDLGAVVSRVVDYLQASQEHLQQPESDSSFSLAKALDDNLISNEMQALLRMAQLIDLTDVRNPMAAAEISTLAEGMGQILDLPAWQIKRLRVAGLLYRLGSFQVSLEENIRRSPAQEKALQHQKYLPKASVLRIMPQMQAIANIMEHQTESWDGSGAPSGLAYDNIPLESRILRLIVDFQNKVSDREHYEGTRENILSSALQECQKQAGKIYDPKLVEVLGLLVMAMEQGMSIKATQPKIAAGMWLLDSDPVVENQHASQNNY